MRLQDKTAIITGSSRGIGKAIAKRFSTEGAKIVINYRASGDLAVAVVNEIRDSGGEAISVQADVSQRAQTDRLREETLEAFGQIDILVSNAGIIIDKPYLESTEEDWDAAINSNLRGFFNVTQSVLPHMIERNYGRVIATGSIINEVAEMARHGITVNSVSPGYIATEMLGEIDAEGLEEALRLVPMRRYGKPEEIAAAMAFLASDDAAYITGQTIRVNGGMSMS